MTHGTAHPIRLLLTGGGTGGHLFPAIAAAEEMCTSVPGSIVMFIGTHRKMDKRSLAEYGYTVKSIHCYGLKGKSLPNLLKAIAVLPVSLVQAIIRIIVFRPDIVLGVGGYVTGPVIAAAKLLGKKTVIHEQNSVPGLANRKLGSLADRVCISLPQSESYFSADKTVLTGNPVRKAILELATDQQSTSSQEKLTLLVLGGSQGAHRVNMIVVEALCKHGTAMNISVIHQTGTADYETVKRDYAAHGIECIVEPFFRNMAEVYAKADLLVSRAGATTLAELAVLGKPAILIPYPYAADNHQQKNAEYYVNGGGCLSFTEKELTAKILADHLHTLLADTEKITEMAANMQKLGCPTAAADIVAVCLDCMKQ